jgi:AcrR family transcriptional regulator
MKLRRLPDFRPRPSGPRCRRIEHPFGRRFGVAIGERYDTILDAALTVFARRGFHQASIREIARTADLSLAGLYHYVGGKGELLFLTLDRTLDRLRAMQDTALAMARTPEARLLALVRAHLQFGFEHADALRLVNREWEAIDAAYRAEIAAKRRQYMERGLNVLAALDPHRRSHAELFAATNLLLGMLNGIATGAFLRSPDDPRLVAAAVGALFLHGFLERSAASVDTAAVSGRSA